MPKTWVYLIALAQSVRSRLWQRSCEAKLGACGTGVRLASDGSYTFKTLFLGDDVIIGTRAILWAVHSRIVIGNKVLIGPEVIIMGGDHNTELASQFMFDLGEDKKRPGDDRDVVIQEDVWIGARATILKGVTVGRGAVVGAGSLVRSSVPPYCVVAGHPARPIRLRGTTAEISEHESKLYPPEKRLSRELLEAIAGSGARWRGSSVSKQISVNAH